MSVKKINLFDYSKSELEDFFLSFGEKKFRAHQLLKWVYHEGVLEFDKMTNLSKSTREHLKAVAELQLPRIVTSQHSNDGTIKWMLSIPGKSSNAIEMVFIPEDTRGTLCISSQAGCVLACPFCSTAHEGFNRNLTTGEVISQVWLALKEINWTKAGKRPITNVVLMGMGEPLLNYEPIVKALNLMTDDLGFGLSKRRVTLSTSGVVPKIYDLKQDADVALAISLHAPTDELRDVLVPINKKYNLAELLAACKDYTEGESRKKITWEYVMLKGVNDSIEHAKSLVQLISKIPGKINLIPFNEFPGTKFEQSDEADILRFQAYLTKKGMVTTVRKTRGEDISAACGQLVGEVDDKSRRARILVRN